MPTVFDKQHRKPDFARYKEQWETGVMAAAISELADLDDSERAALARSWIISSYNGAAFGVYDQDDPFAGRMEWHQSGPTHYDLLYTGPFGVQCSLGRVYEQPNGTWAAMVIAGVKDELPGAIAAAEWAVARLCS